MALDDFLEPEVAVAVAVTAAMASPPVRKAVRRGMVYGLAGLLMAGDKISAAAREMAHSAQQQAAGTTPNAAPEANQLSPTPRVLTT